MWYAWVVPLKHEKSITNTNAFQNELHKSSGKPIKILADKVANFAVDQWNNGPKIMI